MSVEIRTYCGYEKRLDRRDTVESLSILMRQEILILRTGVIQKGRERGVR